MQYQFNHDQLSQDLHDISKFFFDFVKSFGPKPAKIVDRPIGIFEELHIRFRLSLVEMGISYIIRFIIIFIVGIILYFTLFKYAGPLFKIIIGFGFLFYLTWILAPHIATEGKIVDGKIVGKPVGFVSKQLISMYNTKTTVQNNFATSFQELVKDIFPSKKS